MSEPSPTKPSVSLFANHPTFIRRLVSLMAWQPVNEPGTRPSSFHAGSFFRSQSSRDGAGLLRWQVVSKSKSARPVQFRSGGVSLYEMEEAAEAGAIHLQSGVPESVGTALASIPAGTVGPQEVQAAAL